MVWKNGLPDPENAQDGDEFIAAIPLPVVLESLHGIATEAQVRAGGRFILHKDQVIRVGKLVDAKRWSDMPGPVINVKLTTYFTPFKHMIVDVERSTPTTLIHGHPKDLVPPYDPPEGTHIPIDKDVLSDGMREYLYQERERAIEKEDRARKEQAEIKEQIRKLEAQIAAERKANKKRPATLADALISSPGHWWVPKKRFQWLRDKILGAKRFVLDAKGSEYLGEMLKMPELLLQTQEFAIQPFPQMWVEIDYRAMFRGLYGHEAASIDADTHAGWMFDNGSVYGFANNVNNQHLGEPVWNTTAYYLRRPLTLQQESKFCEEAGLSRAQLDGLFWGPAYRDLLENHMDHEVRLLRANHGIGWAYTPTETPLKEAFGIALKNESGELRLILMILLLLNRTSKTQYVQDVEPQRQMFHNKPRTLVKHHVIHFTLNPVEEIKRVGTGVGTAWRREHDVRGHYCHNELARLAEKQFGVCKGITHDWQETSWTPAKSPRQWRCLKCGGLKWWKAEHKRGHAEKGTVTAEYGVTAN